MQQSGFVNVRKFVVLTRRDIFLFSSKESFLCNKMENELRRKFYEEKKKNMFYV